SKDAAFTRPEVVADQSQADLPNPGDNPYVIRPRGKTARYVRMTAKRLWLRTNDYVFALAEMQVQAAGKNLARGAKVTALDSIEAGRWSTKYLVDNFDSRTELPDLANPKVAAVFKRRINLHHQIQEKERKCDALARRLVDAATRTELARVSAELVGLSKQLEEVAAQDQVYALLSHAARPIRLLHRGNVEQPRDLIGPGTLSAVPGLEFDFKATGEKPEGS